MSAPGQAQGGDTATQTQNGGGEAAQENGQQAGPDFGALSSQLEQLVGGQEELRQYLSSEPWRQQAEPETAQQEPEKPEVDLSWLDPADPAYDPEQLTQRLTDTFAQYVEQAQQQAIAPVMQQMTEMRQEAELRDLLQEFPDLGDEQTSRQVVEAAHQYAQALGMPHAANEAGFLRLVYLSGRAIDAAQQEGAEAPGAAHLEGGGGANPGSSQVDPVDAILKPGGKRGASVLDGI